MLETERLQIIPLTLGQLRQWIYDLWALESSLHCKYKATPLEKPFLNIIKGQIKNIAKEPSLYLFHTFWFIIRKEDRTVVGTLVLKGPPDENRAVEIGYGLGGAFTQNGYMTEAVKAFCGWCLCQDGISQVLAETNPDNAPSHNVLKRCGFTLYEKANTLWWKL